MMLSEDRERQENELAALESIFDDERLFVPSLTGCGGQLSITVNIPENILVKYPRERIRGDIVNEEKPITQEQKESHVKLDIKFLPPIVLNFDLPPNYPSSSMPIYTLSCKWLDPRNTSKLCQALDEMYSEQEGNEILYEWVSFISEQTFEILGISSEIILHVNHKAETTDKRAVQDVYSIQGLITSLIDYNQSEERRQFDMSYINCEVCFNEKFGSLCVQFPQCKHAYCKQCMKEYFTVQINDGSVKALKCPEDKCEMEADPGMVKSLVAQELFERYDALLLQRTLDCMTDITYCPRKPCQAPVLKDDDLDLGRCAKCGFVFCILCKHTYHGRGRCPLSSKDMLKMRDKYLKGTEAERADLERRYGKKVIQRVIEESYSEAWLEKFAKSCPSCDACIQKIDGCNKMTCFQCRRNFCWLCSALLPNDNPHAHFSDQKTGCYNKLFEGIEFQFEEDEDEDGWIHFV